MAHPCRRQARNGRQLARDRYADGGAVSAPVDIRSAAQKKGQNSYQPTDPKNIQREVIKTGQWQGEPHSSGELAGDLY